MVSHVGLEALGPLLRQELPAHEVVPSESFCPSVFLWTRAREEVGKELPDAAEMVRTFQRHALKRKNLTKKLAKLPEDTPSNQSSYMVARRAKLEAYSLAWQLTATFCGQRQSSGTITGFGRPGPLMAICSAEEWPRSRSSSTVSLTAFSFFFFPPGVYFASRLWAKTTRPRVANVMAPAKKLHAFSPNCSTLRGICPGLKLVPRHVRSSSKCW